MRNNELKPVVRSTFSPKQVVIRKTRKTRERGYRYQHFKIYNKSSYEIQSLQVTLIINRGYIHANSNFSYSELTNSGAIEGCTITEGCNALVIESKNLKPGEVREFRLGSTAVRSRITYLSGVLEDGRPFVRMYHSPGIMTVCGGIMIMGAIITFVQVSLLMGLYGDSSRYNSLIFDALLSGAQIFLIGLAVIILDGRDTMRDIIHSKE